MYQRANLQQTARHITASYDSSTRSNKSDFRAEALYYKEPLTTQQSECHCRCQLSCCTLIAYMYHLSAPHPKNYHSHKQSILIHMVHTPRHVNDMSWWVRTDQRTVLPSHDLSFQNFYQLTTNQSRQNKRNCTQTKISTEICKAKRHKHS